MKYITHDTLEINLFGTPNGIRTRAVAVKGRCLNRLTMGAVWLRERDSNPRSSDYEPDEIPLLHPAVCVKKIFCFLFLTYMIIH